MYKIGTLNKISPVGLAHLSDNYTVSDNIEGVNGIIVRSQNMHEMKFDKTLLSIARAGAGVNNIPTLDCADQGIVVFNTPGANANSVKELVLAGLLLAARNIPEGVAWAGTLNEDAAKAVEKGKSQFAGHELKGHTLGVIGLGAIGTLVANAALDLGMNVIGYDPYMNLNAALGLKPGIKVTGDLKILLPACDFVTVHVPAKENTAGMLNENVFNMMKDDAVLLNFSRDKLLNEDDLLKALKDGKIKKYVTDFPTDKLIGVENIITIPHLGASTAEAEDNCATMAVMETMDYMENGNIVNSVNFPNVNLGPKGNMNRIAILTKFEPHPVQLATAMFANLNITAVTGAVKGVYGYALLETPDRVESVPALNEVVRVRVIQPDDM